LVNSVNVSKLDSLKPRGRWILGRPPFWLTALLTGAFSLVIMPSIVVLARRGGVTTSVIRPVGSVACLGSEVAKNSTGIPTGGIAAGGICPAGSFACVGSEIAGKSTGVPTGGLLLYGGGGGSQLSASLS
jgi:hypothetical protein